jgi:hypothetical protein
MANTKTPPVLGTVPGLSDDDDDAVNKLLASYTSPQVVSSGQAALQAAQAPADLQTTTPSVLGKVTSPGTGSAPGSDSVAYALPSIASPNASPSDQGLVDEKNSLQASQIQKAADTPEKYDYHAHGFGGNALHVLGRIGNIAGDILAPGQTSLIPGSDLFNARRLAGDNADVKQKAADVANAQKEADAVQNEQANREADAPLKASEISKNNAQAQNYTNKIAQLYSQQGYKAGPPDAEGQPTWVPDQTSPAYQQKQAATNYKNAQTEYESAMQAYKEAQTKNLPEQMQLAHQRLVLAGGNLEMRQKEFLLRTTNTDENGNIYAGATLTDDGTPIGTANAPNVKPTGAQITKHDFAQSALDQSAVMQDIIRRNPDKFGPGPGRAQAFQQWLGSSDKDAARYNAAKTVLGDHQMAVFGGRSAELAQKLSDTSDMRFTADALLAELQQQDHTMGVFLKAGERHTAPGGTSTQPGHNNAGADQHPAGPAPPNAAGSMVINGRRVWVDKDRKQIGQ